MNNIWFNVVALVTIILGTYSIFDKSLRKKYNLTFIDCYVLAFIAGILVAVIGIIITNVFNMFYK